MGLPPEITIRPISDPLDRVICLPGSKSLTNRALLCAALAEGVSTLHDLLLADDTRRMIDALQRLGVTLRLDEERRLAQVAGAAGHWPALEAEIDCGGAGTVLRFLTAACAASTGDYRLDGSPRLRERPILPLVDALRDLGATIGVDPATGGCPLTIAARGLRGGRVVMNSPISSQFLSALLLAAPLARQDVMIRVEGDLLSVPYVRMTIAVMREFGVEVVADQDRAYIVPAPQTYHDADFAIEPDATAATYFFAAAALVGGRLTLDGLGSRSIQGDMRFLDILEQMGCSIERRPASTTVRGPVKSPLRGVDVNLSDMPDTAQTLAVLAAFAEGPTRIRGVGNLRVKETDRLHALATELAKLNVETEIHSDGLTILPNRPPTPARIETYEDHRMAMSFALAGLRLDGVTIADPQCVTKTFPEFFDLWAELG